MNSPRNVFHIWSVIRPSPSQGIRLSPARAQSREERSNELERWKRRYVRQCWRSSGEAHACGCCQFDVMHCKTSRRVNPGKPTLWPTHDKPHLEEKLGPLFPVCNKKPRWRILLLSLFGNLWCKDLRLVKQLLLGSLIAGAWDLKEELCVSNRLGAFLFIYFSPFLHICNQLAS